jgi:serine/threonine protein kinase
LDRKVALKIPTFRESVRDEMLTRFYREARAAAALRDPGICPVYDVGEINGQAFIAMAFIEGRPLRDYTKSGKPHDARRVKILRRPLNAGDSCTSEI